MSLKKETYQAQISVILVVFKKWYMQLAHVACKVCRQSCNFQSNSFIFRFKQQ